MVVPICLADSSMKALKQEVDLRKLKLFSFLPHLLYVALAIKKAFKGYLALKKV